MNTVWKLIVGLLSIAGVLVIIHFLSPKFKHVCDRIAQTIREEFKPRSIIQKINIYGIVLIGVLLIIFSIALIVHELVVPLLNLNAREHLFTITLLFSILFVIMCIISPCLIVKSEKENLLKKRGGKFVNP